MTAVEMLLDLLGIDPAGVERIGDGTVCVTVRVVLEENCDEFLSVELSANDDPQVSLQKLIDLHNEVDANHAEWRDHFPEGK